MNIVNQFHTAAKKYPNNTAIVYKGKAVSFATLQEQVYYKAAQLQRAGIKSNDNIMLMIPYSQELYVTILALFHIGARVVLVDAIKDKQGVLNAYNKAECKGIITLPIIRFLRFFLFAKPLHKKFVSLQSTKITTTYPEAKTKEDAALITFTTGTTGNPKAADRTHGFLAIQLATLIAEMDIKPDDLHISSLPVVLMCNLAVGATSIIPPKPGNRADWKRIERDFSPTLASASPAHFITFLERLSLKNANKIFIGGASILPHFVLNITKRINSKSIHFAYGSTEAEPIALISASEYLQDLAEKGLCVGIPHPNIHVKIAQVHNGAIVELPDGEIGEILVAGEHVLNSYYKDEEAFAKNKIVQASLVWHRTGDIGYMKKGKIYFYGRQKHSWKQGEEWVSPVVYEKYISQYMPNVEATWQHVQERNVVFAVGTTIKELEALNRKFDYPIDDIQIMSKLPRDARHMSRIDYEKLAQLKFVVYFFASKKALFWSVISEV